MGGFLSFFFLLSSFFFLLSSFFFLLLLLLSFSSSSLSVCVSLSLYNKPLLERKIAHADQKIVLHYKLYTVIKFIFLLQTDAANTIPRRDMKAFSPWMTKQGGKGLTSGSNIVRPRRRRSIGVLLFLLVALATYSSFDVSKWIGLSRRTFGGNENQEEEDQGGWGGSFLHQSSNTELNQYFEERSHDHPYAQCSGKYFEIEGFLNDSELPDNILERLLSKSQIPQEENAGLDFGAVGISEFLVRGNASQSFLPVNSQHVPCK